MVRAPLQSQAVVVGPKVPYPPTYGFVKRTLRLLEAIERSGAGIHFLTRDEPSPEAREAFCNRGWRLETISDDVGGTRDRATQHVRRLPSRHSRALTAAIRAACASRPTAFLQVEGGGYNHYLEATGAVPRVLSTHNADGAVARAAVEAAPRRSVARIRANYHAHRWARVERQVCAAADAVLCVSPQDSDYFSQLSRKVVLAPNGIDDGFFSVDPRPFANQDLLFFGQMRYGPNVDGIRRFVAEGWRHFAARTPRGRLLIAGEGSEEVLADLAVDPRIKLLGLVDDIVAQVGRARIVIVPIWQGGGTRLKVLEALAAARPVVGTPLGVSGLGFENDKHGLVALDPASLAELASDLCASDGEWSRLATSGRVLAEEYRWHRALGPAETLFSELVERHRGR